MAATPTPIDSPTLPAAWPAVALPPAPSTAHRANPAWGRIARAFGWLPARRTDADLQAAREAFTACLADLPPLDSQALCQLLGHARSLGELWHLRPEVYRHLALHHTEAEAACRLGRLDHWFAALPRPQAAAILRGA
jgi:hypothetical protein